MAMKVANIAELKNRISEYLAAVENGIVATARIFQCAVVTADRRIRDYPHVDTTW
jgi:antitoxin (DNA-binding transcriptional repressor) of toxin-antitoxin stability system